MKKEPPVFVFLWPLSNPKHGTTCKKTTEIVYNKLTSYIFRTTDRRQDGYDASNQIGPGTAHLLCTRPAPCLLMKKIWGYSTLRYVCLVTRSSSCKPTASSRHELCRRTPPSLPQPNNTFTSFSSLYQQKRICATPQFWGLPGPSSCSLPTCRWWLLRSGHLFLVQGFNPN